MALYTIDTGCGTVEGLTSGPLSGIAQYVRNPHSEIKWRERGFRATRLIFTPRGAWQYRGKSTLEIDSTNVVLGNPDWEYGCRHLRDCVEDANRVVLYDPSVLERALLDDPIVDDPVAPFQIDTISLTPKIARKAAAIFAEAQAGEPGYLLRVDAMALDLLATALQMQREALCGARHEGRLRRHKDALGSAKRFIEEHYARPLALAELAAMVRLSPFYFQRLFQAEYGCSPLEYQMHVRIARAKAMLEKDGERALDVGFAVGFGSTAHFIRVFRSYTATTPGAYRRNFGGGSR
jgi:AraC-like DNA-binding protein